MCVFKPSFIPLTFQLNSRTNFIRQILKVKYLKGFFFKAMKKCYLVMIVFIVYHLR